MWKKGGGKSERITGSRGDDVIYGRGGDDMLFGKAGKDSLFGGRGDDALFGGPGVDRLKGGKGADVYVLRTAADLDKIVGFKPGVDSILYTDVPMDHVYDAPQPMTPVVASLDAGDDGLLIG